MNIVTRLPAIDELDRGIIKAVQAGLPLCAQPYAAIGEAVGLSGADVMQRMKRMLANGSIRRIGAVPNHYRLGYVANGMTVWDVDDAAVLDLGRRVGELSFVSHCYQRPRHPPLWPYNLFAMVHGKSRSETNDEAAEIRALLGARCRCHDILYSTRILKKTGLRLSE